jgi:hypothetical protein
VALDVATGEIQQTHEVDSVPFRAVTMANDLPVTSTFEGAVLALDQETGEEARLCALRQPEHHLQA